MNFGKSYSKKSMAWVIMFTLSCPWAEVFQGTLQVMTHDKIDGTVEYFHELHIGSDQWVRLEYPTTESRTLYSPTGERVDFDTFRREVKVEGTMRDDRIYVGRLVESSRSRFSAPPLPEPEPSINGKIERTALVLKIGFQGRPNNMNENDVHESIFGETGRTTNAFYDEGSYGTFKLVGIQNPEGDIYSLTLSGTSCDSYGGYRNAASAAKDMARNAGFDVGEYDVVVHVFVTGDNSCPGGGVAGGTNAHLFVNLSAVWDYGAHEIGHCNVIGSLGHASSWKNCTSGSGGNTVTFGSNCEHLEYGDQSDIMGRRNFQFSAFHMERAGWFPEANRLDVTESRRVTILPINLPASGVQTVYVHRNFDPEEEDPRYFNLEFRRPVGFDERIGSGLTNGILVRTTGEPRARTNHILDMTPGTGGGDDREFQDAALGEGRTFRSTQSGDDIEITVVEITDEHAVVEVIIDGEPVTPINEEAIRQQAAENRFYFALPGSRVLSVPLGISESVGSVDVLDAQGRVVHHMNNEERSAKESGMRWNGVARDGTRMNAGTYFFRFNTDKQSIVRQAVLLP